MQTALRVQAISSGIANQIYLEPQLDIKKLLAGEGAKCDRISYWRYQRIQAYQTVKQLLEGGDFRGAIIILQNWQKALDKLAKSRVTELDKLTSNQQLINLILKVLNITVSSINGNKDSLLPEELNLSDHVKVTKEIHTYSDIQHWVMEQLNQSLQE